MSDKNKPELIAELNEARRRIGELEGLLQAGASELQGAKEDAREVAREAVREDAREVAREVTREDAREVTREGAREVAREDAREVARGETTLRREALGQRQHSEDEFRAMIESSPDVFTVLTPEGTVTYVSPSVTPMLGRRPEDVVGEDAFAWIHPEDLPAARQAFREIVWNPGFASGEFRLAHADGSWRYMRLEGQSHLHASGEPFAVIILQDLTTSREGVERYRQVNRILQVLRQCNQSLMRATDEASLLQAICNHLIEVGGYRFAWIGFAENDEHKSIRPAAFAGHEESYLAGLDLTWANTERGQGPTGTAIRTGRPVACRDIASDPDAAPWREAALQRGYASSFSLPLESAGGVLGALTVYAGEPNAFNPQEVSLLVELAGDLSYGLVVLRARVERDRAEGVRRESETVALSFFESSGALRAVVELEAEDLLLLAGNAQWPEYFGLSPEFRRNRRFSEMGFPSETTAILRERLEESQRLRQPVTFDLLHSRPSGNRALEVEGIYLGISSDDSRTGPRFTLVAHDVTEARQAAAEHEVLEQQLYQAQKLEALGTLSGGIAHDFNNLLTGIIGMTELALQQVEPNSEVYEYLSPIPEQGRRAAGLIVSMMAFSRRAAGERRPLAMIPLFKEVGKILQSTLPERLDVHLSWPEDLPLIQADATQIQQIMMNLATNARDAMPEQGDLYLEVAQVIVDEEHRRLHPEAAVGDYVRLSVRDSGVGMTPEVRERIFEPFFTTKGVGEGTGLGLAMVYGIVKGHGGFIEVSSEPGQGTEFQIYLPILADQTNPTPESEGLPPPGGDETLLVVEDSPEVLRVAKSMLEMLGYVVLSASDGQEALETYRSRSGEIALVLTDMIMPKMGGKTLCEEIARIDPAARLVLVSGYSVEEDLEPLRALGVRGFIQKPYDLARLAHAVREALDS